MPSLLIRHLALFFWLASSCILVVPVSALSSVAPPKLNSPKFVILGGTGKIGTAVASHLLRRAPTCEIVLVGRRAEGEAAIQDVLQQVVPNNVSENQVSYHCVPDIWNTDQDSALTKLFQSDHKISGVIHTAGPYAEESPTVLEAVIAAKIPVYVDVSDPLDFLDASLQQSQAAVEAGTTALCAAGAFPGMSNVSVSYTHLTLPTNREV